MSLMLAQFFIFNLFRADFRILEGLILRRKSHHLVDFCYSFWR